MAVAKSTGGSKSPSGDDGSTAGCGNTNDESSAGSAGIATGASDSSNADRGKVADVGDIWGDFRRKYVEIGVLAWESASCNHVSLPHRDNLPLGGEDLGPRVARERGEGSGEVEGVYRGGSTIQSHGSEWPQDLPSLLSLPRIVRGGFPSVGSA
jgi:hypothetical protein